MDEFGFRAMLAEVSNHIEVKELDAMKFMCSFIPKGNIKDISSPVSLFEVLLQREIMSPTNLNFLKQLLKSATGDRRDVMRIIDKYETSLMANTEGPKTVAYLATNDELGFTVEATNIERSPVEEANIWRTPTNDTNIMGIIPRGTHIRTPVEDTHTGKKTIEGTHKGTTKVEGAPIHVGRTPVESCHAGMSIVEDIDVELSGKKYSVGADTYRWTQRSASFPSLDPVKKSLCAGYSDLDAATENSVYQSVNKPHRYSVLIHPTNIAKNCHLVGNFTLHVGTQEMSVLKPGTQNALAVWPYLYIRRYSYSADNFSFEAGRSSVTGPGTFVLETSEAKNIYTLIQSFINAIKVSRIKQPSTSEMDVNMTDNPCYNLY